MAVASNKPGFVHYALILSVMITVVLGFLSGLNHRELAALRVKIAESEKQLSGAKRLIATMSGLETHDSAVKATALEDMRDFANARQKPRDPESVDQRELADQIFRVAEVEEQVRKLMTLVKSYDDQVQILKNLTGRKFELVDDPANPENVNTVKAAALKDISDFGKEYAGENYTETLRNLREALDAAIAERGSKAAHGTAPASRK